MVLTRWELHKRVLLLSKSMNKKLHWCQRWYCGARLAALTFPPAPFLSPAGGEEGGGRSLPFPLAPSPLRSSLGVLVPAPVGAGSQPARWAAGCDGHMRVVGVAPSPSPGSFRSPAGGEEGGMVGG